MGDYSRRHQGDTRRVDYSSYSSTFIRPKPYSSHSGPYMTELALLGGLGGIWGPDPTAAKQLEARSWIQGLGFRAV